MIDLAQYHLLIAEMSAPEMEAIFSPELTQSALIYPEMVGAEWLPTEYNTNSWQLFLVAAIEGHSFKLATINFEGYKGDLTAKVSAPWKMLENSLLPAIGDDSNKAYLLSAGTTLKLVVGEVLYGGDQGAKVVATMPLTYANPN